MRYLLLVLFTLFFCSTSAQYAFELSVDYATQIGNTEQYSISGTLLKGQLENNKKYYLTSGAEFNVKNLMSARTGTSVKNAKSPERVSVGLICKNYVPQTGIIIKGISTQPKFNGQLVATNYADKLPEGLLKLSINGMQFKATQISKPIRTKSSDILDMFFKTKGKEVFWLQIGNVNKIEELPARIVCDSALIGTNSPYARIVFMPDGFQPTDLPDRYKGYEDKFGKASILITQLKKFTFQATLEFAGPLRPNKKVLADNPNAGILQLKQGRVDKVIWEEH